MKGLMTRQPRKRLGSGLGGWEAPWLPGMSRQGPGMPAFRQQMPWIFMERWTGWNRKMCQELVKPDKQIGRIIQLRPFCLSKFGFWVKAEKGWPRICSNQGRARSGVFPTRSCRRLLVWQAPWLKASNFLETVVTLWWSNMVLKFCWEINHFVSGFSGSNAHIEGMSHVYHVWLPEGSVPVPGWRLFFFHFARNWINKIIEVFDEQSSHPSLHLFVIFAWIKPWSFQCCFHGIESLDWFLWMLFRKHVQERIEKNQSVSPWFPHGFQ